MRRPVIGIPCLAVQSEWYGLTSGNYLSYLRAVEAGGGIPLLIHLTSDQEVLRTLYSLCDGLLFAGGNDVEPSRYGAAAHPALEAISPQQDEVELTLAAWARADNKPLLGICRGLQLLNVAFGGSLYQDINSEVGDSFDHRDSSTRQDWTHLAHSISIDADSWLAEHLGTTEIGVNTLHHQSINEVAPGLRVVARALDGVVEAAEGTGEQFVAAVQCHPEMLWETTDPRWQRFFAAFVRRCAESRP